MERSVQAQKPESSEPPQPSFGAWLKQQRKSRRLTQEELAERLACSSALVYKIEAGERTPSLQIASLIADWLNIPAEDRSAFMEFARGQLALDAVEAHTTFGGASLARTPSAGNLPVLLTHLIGRAEEVEEVASLLMGKELRLLTLTGPPGIGKTSLALQVGHQVKGQFRDGAYFVALAPVTDPDFVVPTIAQTLGLTDKGAQSLLENLKQHLSGRQMMLLLDNYEQVLDASPAVVQLLVTCPGLSVLVTSREALHVPGEQQFQVPGLETADPAQLPPLEILSNIPAVALFVERARAIKSSFALTEQNAHAVALVCTRLQGLPLAIELAAARVNVLSLQEIQSRLDDSLSLLESAARHLPPKQRTLRGAIDWSYQLLSAMEKRLFARLGVFVGGCTLAAAEAVCNAKGDINMGMLEGLASLVDKSLVQREEDVGGESRFTMLEMIGQDARERLEKSGEAAGIHRSHAEYFLAFAETADAQLRGSDQVIWLERLEREHDNLRAALDWTAREGDTELTLRLAGALGWFWQLRGYFTEGESRLARMLSVKDTSASPIARARALNALGRLLQSKDENAAAKAPLEESLSLAREAGDNGLMLLVLHNLGNVAQDLGANDAARDYHEKSLRIAQETGDQWGIAWGLMGLGHVAMMEDDLSGARSFFERSLVVRREMGDRWGIARSLNELGDIARLQRDYTAARSFYEESLLTHRDLGHKGFMDVGLYGLACVDVNLSDYESAVKHFEEALVLFQDLGNKAGIGLCLAGLGVVAYKLGTGDHAARLFGAASEILQAVGYHMDRLDRAAVEEPMARVRAEKSLVDAWEAGRSMSLEQAIAYAVMLQQLNPA